MKTTNLNIEENENDFFKINKAKEEKNERKE